MTTITHLGYVPILKWRQGEYQALLHLNSNQKNMIVPLIEITPPDFDFETRNPKKTLDEHLEKFAARLELKWGKRIAFVDAGLLNSSARMIGGIHPLAWLFQETRSQGVPIVPVTGMDRDAAYQAAVRDVHALDACGIAFRCSLEDVTDLDFSRQSEKIFNYLNITLCDVDVILDLKSPNFKPLDGLVKLIGSIISKSSFFEKSRSFTIVGTSFPSSMSDVTGPIEFLPREEWLLYKSLVATILDSGRVPAFGDYAVASPDLPRGDMRLFKPSATVRYAVDDGWLIAKGVNVRDNGFKQYRNCCGDVTDSPRYLGKAFSAGSDYIERCRNGDAATGNLTTWRWVGTNHHIAKVVYDLANFHGF